MYKGDWSLYNLRCLICNKTKPNQSEPIWKKGIVIGQESIQKEGKCV